ncbi:MAG: M20/M25/M40 family metallo-hydrolase [Anaerolineae bacterium]|nr:M20/M25/M40 family metallo-hydrolase [Anaerolineae bacterium]
MNSIPTLAARPSVQALLTAFHQMSEQVVDLAVTVQQIPAPTFAEATRAAFIEQELTAVGLQDVAQDELHNVFGRLPAAHPTHPPVIISAHSDTVFPIETDLAVRRDGGFVYGPGIADNSTGVAGVITLARVLCEAALPLAADLWFVANVGEEGLGDLRGMRAVVDRFGSRATYIVVEGGLYGQISHQGIGVRRFKLTVETPGGHSWGNFGVRSAVHELARLIVAIDRLTVPKTPKTTYNVGVIEGGTSINSIAQSASGLLDLRSESPADLEGLVTAVSQIIEQANKRRDVRVSMELIGNRPAGALAADAPLVQWAVAALQAVGCAHPRLIASSTDANVPLSEGYTAVCIGLAESHHAHRLDEYLDPQHLPRGLGQLLLLTLAASGYQAQTVSHYS